MDETRTNKHTSKEIYPFKIEFDNEIWDRLRAYCVASGRTVKAVVQYAVLEHIEKPVRPFPPLLEEIADRKRLGRRSLESDPNGSAPKAKRRKRK